MVTFRIVKRNQKPLGFSVFRTVFTTTPFSYLARLFVAFSPHFLGFIRGQSVGRHLYERR